MMMIEGGSEKFIIESYHKRFFDEEVNDNDIDSTIFLFCCMREKKETFDIQSELS